MINIFDEIRSSCKHVAENARWVSVNYDRVVMYPELILAGQSSELTHSPEHHFLDQGDDTLKFFLLLDSLNFGSGYFPFLKKDSGFSGYYTVATKLSQHVRDNGIPSPESLLAINTDACAAIFGQTLDNPHVAELMQYFAMSLSDLGRWICEAHGGDYLGVLRAAQSASDVVVALQEMPLFRDVSRYYDRDVWFLKRAQIFLHDIKIAAPNHPLIQFHDLNNMTIFADNLLPFVFRSDGLLTCHPWLEKRIDSEELIASGSIEEIELRACSIHIAEIICKIAREEHVPLSARQLDYYLWMKGQQLKSSTTFKRHRTRCPYY